MSDIPACTDGSRICCTFFPAATFADGPLIEEPGQLASARKQARGQLKTVNFGQANVDYGSVKTFVPQDLFTALCTADPIHRVSGIAKPQLDASGQHHRL